MPSSPAEIAVNDSNASIELFEKEIQVLSVASRGRMRSKSNGDPWIVNRETQLEKYKSELAGIAKDFHELRPEELVLFNVYPFSLLPSRNAWKIVQRANRLKVQVDEDVQQTTRATTSRKQSTLLSEFRRAGSFPKPEKLVEHPSLEKEQCERYSPDGLRKTYSKLSPEKGCDALGCGMNCDAIKGDSSYHRHLCLKEACSEVILLVDNYHATQLKREEELKILDDILSIGNEVVAAVIYFFHSQYESRLLIEKYRELIEIMKYRFRKMTSASKYSSIAAIELVLDAVKRHISAVIQHHDRVNRELLAAKNAALNGVYCKQGQCRSRLEELLKKGSATHVVDPHDWMCKDCSRLSYEDTIQIIMRTVSPSLDVSSNPNIRVNKSSANGGYAQFYTIGRENMDKPELKPFRHNFDSGLVLKVIKSPEMDEPGNTKYGTVENRHCLRFVRELLTWRKIKHPNIVPFLGVCIHLSRVEVPCIVLPWINGGCLHDYIFNQEVDFPLPKEVVMERLDLMHDVASAIEYMHCELHIVHGDLKADNVLLHRFKDEDGNRRYRALLTDFGLSALQQYRGLTTEVHGHSGFVAPEQVHAVADPYRSDSDKVLISKYLEKEDPARPTIYTDMYSFGCLFFQVMSNNAPFSFEKKESAAMRLEHVGYIPTCPEYVWPSHYELMVRCWHLHPASRATATIAKDELSGFMEAVRIW